MPFNGAGVFEPIAAPDFPAVSGTVISSASYNAVLNDIFNNGLSGCITKDGQTVVTANIPLGGFKITGLASGAATTDAATILQAQLGTLQWAAAAGTADVITAAYTPALTALVNGTLLGVRAATANATTTPTFSPNGLAAHTIVKLNRVALVAGDIAGADHDLLLRYNLANTEWELLNPAFSANPIAQTVVVLAGGALSLVGDTVIPISAGAAAYRKLKLAIMGLQAGVNFYAYIRLNADAGANYAMMSSRSNEASGDVIVASFGTGRTSVLLNPSNTEPIDDSAGTANPLFYELEFPTPSGVAPKVANFRSGLGRTATGALFQIVNGSALWTPGATLTEVDLILRDTAGNNPTGAVVLATAGTWMLIGEL